MEDKIIRSAIRELREHMGLNQISFSVREEKAYPTVQRYEQQRSPPVHELGVFYKLANEAGRVDLAIIFRDAAIQGIPGIVEMVKDERTQAEAKTAKQTGTVRPNIRKRA